MVLKKIFVSILAWFTLINSIQVLAEESLSNNLNSQSDTVDNLQETFSGNNPQANGHAVYTGLYPFLEGTGYTPSQYSLQLTSNELAYSLMDNLVIGTQPVWFVYRTPNVFVKARLFKNNRHSIALNTGLNVILVNSGDYFSKNYPGQIKNPSSNVFAIPVTLSHSIHLNRYLDFHHTVSDLNQLAQKDVKNKATFGYSAMLQLKATPGHSIFLHAGEIGFWNHDLYYSGVSYRFTHKEFFAQLGYFIRVEGDEVQKSPLFDVGFVL